MAETQTSRAGCYEHHPSGYRAFVPATLPLQSPVSLHGELQALHSKTDRALGRLDGSVQTLPNPGLFVFMYVRKEAVPDALGELERFRQAYYDHLQAVREKGDWERGVVEVSAEATETARRSKRFRLDDFWTYAQVDRITNVVCPYLEMLI